MAKDREEGAGETDVPETVTGTAGPQRVKVKANVNVMELRAFDVAEIDDSPEVQALIAAGLLELA